jgi:hypothetical protein
MTEAEWLASDDPMRMLAFPKANGRSDRKLRLFACGCYRQVPDCLADERTRSAVEVAERHADGLAGAGELRVARTAKGGPHNARFWVTRTSAFTAASGALWSPLDEATCSFDPVSRHHRFPNALALLRDVYGNPFRPVSVRPAWLAWNDAAIPRLAQAIYDDRAFDRLPVLADALEDAGCADRDVLGHLRGPGPHVRGCWALDLVLDKE